MAEISLQKLRLPASWSWFSEVQHGRNVLQNVFLKLDLQTSKMRPYKSQARSQISYVGDGHSFSSTSEYILRLTRGSNLP